MFVCLYTNGKDTGVNTGPVDTGLFIEVDSQNQHSPYSIKKNNL